MIFRTGAPFGMRGIRARAIVLGTVPLLFLLFVLSAVATLQHEVQVTAGRLNTSNELLSRLKDYNDAINKASEAASTFIFTGDARQLPVFNRQSAVSLRHLNELAAAVAGDPPQAKRVANIRVSTQTAFAQLREYIGFTQRHDRAGLNRAIAISLKKAQSKKAKRAAISAQEAAFQEAEQKVRDDTENQRRTLWLALDGLLVVASITGIVLTVLLTVGFGRRIVTRLETLASNAARFAKTGEFEQQIEGDDEITSLQRVYADMVRAVREREGQMVRYQLLSQQTRDIMLFIRRRDGRILEANDAASAAYGYSREELLKMRATDLRAPSMRADIEEQLTRADEGNILFETFHLRNDGSTFPVEISARGAFIDGERVILSVIRDITERMESDRRLRSALEQAIEASRLKSEFVATMSHEIRTPMNGVIGMTDLLLKTNLTAEQRDFAEIVRDSGNALLLVINDILDFSKIEAGKLDLETTEFDLTQLVEGVAALLMPQAHKKQLSLMSFVDPKVKVRLRGDGGRLRQVLLNLAGNAVKFTDTGNVVVRANLVSSDPQKLWIRFSVEDTGIGIASEVREKLFEPFRQGDATTSRRHGGTGLGLSISQRLVEMMGGKIEAQSAINSGSIFSFTLPFESAQTKLLPMPVKLPGTRALIVDDDALSCHILSEYLQSWGIEHSAVSDPRIAVETLMRARDEETPFDVVLLDFDMPHLDGFSVADRIRSEPSLQGTRLVLITAYDEAGKSARAIRAGFSAYLVKPIKQSQLFDAIVTASAALESTMAASFQGNPVIVAPRREMRILVAEDNAINRELAIRQLASLGYAADCVSNGEEAVAMAASGLYEVVLMDCQMPVMDGFAATRAIRKLETRTGGHTTIIAMTANALSTDRDACLEAGMDHYISKPVILERLQAILDGISGESSAASPAGISNGERAPLDFDRLRSLFGADTADAAQFLASASQTLAALVQSLESEDAAEIRRVAHEIKGSAANLGALQLSAASADLEHAGPHANRKALIQAVRAALENLQTVIETYRESVLT